MVRLVIAADTHNLHTHIEWPAGDILVIPGDFTRAGLDHEIISFRDWIINDTTYKYAVILAGNHDRMFQHNPDKAKELLLTNPIIHYLEDSEVELEGLQFYGTPWQPKFSAGWVFNMRSETELLNKWKLIPAGTDVLITHSPPAGILDKTYNDWPAGSMTLRDEVLDRIKPKIHCFGHIHESYGIHQMNGTTFINASLEPLAAWEPLNPPIVIDL